MINNAIIMGRLTADAELRTTNSGVNVTSFTVAVDRSFVKAGEQRQADFINVVAWRQTADFVTRYFHKGSMIAVSGSIQTRNYEDKQGNKRTAFEIVASEVSFCGAKNESDDSVSLSTAKKDATKKTSAKEDACNFEMIDGDDELPF